MRGRRLLVAAATVLLTGMTAAPAHAHTDLVGADPAPGSVLGGAAADLTLSFTDPLVAEGTQIVVRDASGTDLAGAPAVSGTQARVPLEALRGPGRYQVTYRVVGVDGHPVTGAYSFRVDRGAPAARAVAAGATAPLTADGSAAEAGGLAVDTAAVSPRSTSSTWAIGGLGIATLGALLLAGARRRPQTTGTRS
jgi:methionine-rich copper-binding protein CopC